MDFHAGNHTRAHTGGVTQAVVRKLEGERRVRVHLQGSNHSCSARLATVERYQAAVGDRVLVALDGPDAFVIGVLHAAAPSAPSSIAVQLTTRDGARATLEDGALALRDADGRLLLRYQDGCITATAPAGDLTLAAPGGRVRLHSGLDIDLQAGRDICAHAGRRSETTIGSAVASRWALDERGATLKSDAVRISSTEMDLQSERVRIVAKRLVHTAERLLQQVDHYEVQATRMVERARDIYRDAGDLLQTRVGRARTMVRDVFALYSRRNVQVSEGDTAIDGKRVLLG